MTQSPHRKQVVILEGDGVGPEVMAEARKVLKHLVASRHMALDLRDLPYGLSALRDHGQLIPNETMAALPDADAILFGAMGGPEYDALPHDVVLAGSLLHIRGELDLYANLRPVVSTPALAESSTLKADVLAGLDLIFVRELTGGVYFGQPRGIETLPDGSRRGVNTHVYTSGQIERIARTALDLARQRRGRCCSVEKGNVMEAGMLWRQEVQTLRDAEFPDVELTHMLADNCAMQLVRAPSQFDVIVTDNLFGDILSDCAAMAVGSLGMMPSASLGPRRADGRRSALFEPVHGSAPDIAGRGVANPLAAILSLAMALRHALDEPAAADLVEDAVTLVLEGGARTADIATPGAAVLSTGQMGAAVLGALKTLQLKARHGAR